MSASAGFIQVTPFVYVPSLDAALEFFCDRLGFALGIRAGDYAYVQRERVGFRLCQNSEVASAPPGNGRFAYYIDVRDVDGLYAALRAELDGLPPGDVHGPVDEPYGQRELTVIAPDGNRLVFGQQIAPTKGPQPNPIAFHRRDLSGSTFTSVRLAGAAFTKADLSGATFSDVRLASATFSDVDLSSVAIANSRLAGMRIDGILVTDLLAAYRATRSAP